MLGHWLTYVIAVRDVRAREALLGLTGHGYWPAAAAAATVLGLAEATRVILGHLAGVRRGRNRQTGPGLAARLALAQVAIYLVQETLERLAAGAPLSTLAQDHLLQLGILIQVLVAAASAILLAWLGRAAEAAGRALRRSSLARPPAFPIRPAGLVLPHQKPRPRINAIRAPPTLADAS
jgi:hypothetical protein